MKHLSLVLIAALYSTCAVAQSFVGFSSDNYSGVHQGIFNPAFLVDSKLKVDVNLISVGASFATDYTDLTLDNIQDILNAENLSDANTNPKDDNRVWLYADILGPSFFFKLNEKSAIGFTSRLRTLGNFENISGELLESAINGFPNISYSFSQENLSFQTHPFAEFGVSYSRVLYDEDRLRLKGGASIKYLLGGGVAQGFSESLAGRYSLFTGDVSFSGDFAYQLSYTEDQEILNPEDILSNAESGLAFDLGFVLDIRPKDWDNSGVTGNPYMFRVGVALTDLGRVTYSVDDNRYAFDSSDIDGDQFEENIEDALNAFVAEESTRDLAVSLPSTLRVTVDYHITNNLFANLDVQQNLVSTSGPSSRALNRITFTPRLETGLIGLYLPISHNEFAGGAVGAGLRLGPLVVGSQTVISNLFSDNANLAHAYFGLKVPIKHKKIKPVSN